jgi:hypothetical protein
MSQITVYKCDHTGKLFEDVVKYRKHLKKLAVQRREQRKFAIDRSKRDGWWLQLQQRAQTLDELKQFIIENQQFFWAESADCCDFNWKNAGKSRNGVVMPCPELVSFTCFDLKWSDSVRNTHHCPKNGVINWSCKDTFSDGRPKPTGYPGWHGRVEWTVKWPKEWDGVYLGADLFKGQRCRIYTGTGGGGNMRNGLQTFGYSAIIFAEDWPGLYQAQMKQQWINHENRRRRDLWRHLGGSGSIVLVDTVPDNWVCDPL